MKFFWKTLFYAVLAAPLMLAAALPSQEAVTANNHAKIYVRPVSFDWQNATIAYHVTVPGFVSVKLSPGDIRVKSEEVGGTGRFYFKNLKPSTTYNGILQSAAGECKFSFTTLPAPQGEMLGHFALISDPHISLKPENRKGRFFIESASIAEDVINLCRKLNCTTTIWPGDITNSGAVAEYELAASVLKKSPAKSLVIPGNHDHMERSASRAAFVKHFGNPEFTTILPGIGTLAALDTGRAAITPDGAAILEKAIKTPGRLIVVSHYQLFPAPWISHGKKGSKAHTIRNAKKHEALLKKLADRPGTVIYCGHQNVMARTVTGKTTQLNLPQPPQYPCGFIYVRCFKNGFYHTFVPISSEAMNQWSRLTGNAEAQYYKQLQWHELYRQGKDLTQSNFFLPLQ